MSRGAGKRLPALALDTFPAVYLGTAHIEGRMG